jgi:maltooligosyltrehalose trehalohydrolase
MKRFSLPAALFHAVHLQRMQLGALPTATGTDFRVWAPSAQRVEVVLESSERSHPLDPVGNGYFAGTIADLGSGALYRYRLDERGPYPDPASRFQPEGPHGPSMVINPLAYSWRDAGWRGVQMHGQVVYELHVGAFTEEGTFDAAIAPLEELKRLGITLIEVMPIAEFPGRWNWGYDGVNLFAPYHGYGDHDALKRFVDAAHAIGIGVVLDVVYNHFGPDGNYLREFSGDYFNAKRATDWGESINFDGANSREVREFFLANACYWVREFHLDGLRLDATQSIFDSSSPHILAELSRRTRQAAAPRSIVLIAENEPQDARQLLPVELGGYGLDAMWSDDFHHSARVALTGRHDGYFHDHRGEAQEFVSAVKRGFLFQGQYYHWQKQPRGTPVTTQPANAFVFFIQNHDQVANTLSGERVHRISSPGRLRALTALTLLAPQTPLIFMGQEFAASQRFPFFADHAPELASLVHRGRREFVSQFDAFATPAAQARVPHPADPATFHAAKLDFAERETNVATYRLFQDLLALRRSDPVIARQDRFALDGAVLASRALVLRWFDATQGDRLLLVNLGDEIDLVPAPEPLLAPPLAADWQLLWSSDEPRYAGLGVIDPCSATGWRLPAESAALLRAVKASADAV